MRLAFKDANRKQLKAKSKSFSSLSQKIMNRPICTTSSKDSITQISHKTLILLKINNVSSVLQNCLTNRSLKERKRCNLRKGKKAMSYEYVTLYVCIRYTNKDINLTRYRVQLLSMTILRFTAFLVLVLASFSQDARPQTDEERFASMRRTACLILTRYHSNTQKQTIEGTVQSLPPTDQQKYINKIYAVGVEICEPQITQSQVQEFFVETDAFDPSHMFYLLQEINYGQIVNNLDTTKNQDQIIKFIKHFDEQMAVRREEQEAEKEKESADEKYQMKFLGISINDIPSGAKLVYVLIFAALVSGALYYGFKQVDQPKEKSKNKRRSPKKDSAKKE